MRRIVDGFTTMPPMAGSPPIVLLATDGLPDTCADIDENGNTVAQNLSISETQRGFTMGIKTYILSVGNQVGAPHLQRLANAGAGLDPATGTAPFYTANDPAQLSAALQAIITGALSCDFDLTSPVADPTTGAGAPGHARRHDAHVPDRLDLRRRRHDPPGRRRVYVVPLRLDDAVRHVRVRRDRELTLSSRVSGGGPIGA
jgi:hypothetical protein